MANINYQYSSPSMQYFEIENCDAQSNLYISSTTPNYAIPNSINEVPYNHYNNQECERYQPNYNKSTNYSNYFPSEELEPRFGENRSIDAIKMDCVTNIDSKDENCNFTTEFNNDFIKFLKSKHGKEEIDLFCYICNYGFKSFPRLIRHMETKKHANQVEKYHTLNMRCCQSQPKDITQINLTNHYDYGMELLPDEIINQMIDSLGMECDDNDFFSDIDTTDLSDILEYLK